MTCNETGYGGKSVAQEVLEAMNEQRYMDSILGANYNAANPRAFSKEYDSLFNPQGSGIVVVYGEKKLPLLSGLYNQYTKNAKKDQSQLEKIVEQQIKNITIEMRKEIIKYVKQQSVQINITNQIQNAVFMNGYVPELVKKTNNHHYYPLIKPAGKSDNNLSEKIEMHSSPERKIKSGELYPVWLNVIKSPAKKYKKKKYDYAYA